MDITGQTGKVWLGNPHMCWCPAEIVSRSESGADMWTVICRPPSGKAIHMERVNRTSIKVGNEIVNQGGNICMNGGSYKKYKTKKRKRKSNKRKHTKRRKSKKHRKSKTKRRR